MATRMARIVEVGILLLISMIVVLNTACAESCIGPPIGEVVVEFSPSSTVSPGDPVDVKIKWWITDATYSNYEGPFNLHVALINSSGVEVDSWTLHVCNYCCGNSCPSCSATCSCSDSQCSCSPSCCNCSNTSGCTCCGYIANETVPYEYEFSNLAPSEPGTYYLDVQVVASCLVKEVGKSGQSHTLLVASQQNTLTTIPEFPTIVVPAAVIVGLLLIVRRK